MYPDRHEKYPIVKQDKYTGQAIADQEITFDWWSEEWLRPGQIYYLQRKKWGAAKKVEVLSSSFYAGNRWRNIGIDVDEIQAIMEVENTT